MKRLHTMIPLLLLLFLTTALASCGDKPGADSKSPSAPESGPDSAPAVTAPPTQAAPLRILLPAGSCADIVAQIPAAELTLQLDESPSADASKNALLDGSADLILLSPQSAADLYLSGKMVQLVALLSPGDPTLPEAMECLVASSDFLAQEGDLISRFLAAYQSSAARVSAPEASLITGWDMVDLVQQSLEAQYEAQPDPGRTIPDGKFYFIPS